MSENHRLFFRQSMVCLTDHLCLGVMIVFVWCWKAMESEGMNLAVCCALLKLFLVLRLRELALSMPSDGQVSGSHMKAQAGVCDDMSDARMVTGKRRTVQTLCLVGEADGLSNWSFGTPLTCSIEESLRVKT